MAGCYDDICGEFTTPATPLKGQCTPWRLKKDCGLTPPYVNDEAQTCTDTCPEGSISPPIIVTIGTGTVASAFSTSNANDLAMVEACRQAAALRSESPCLYANAEQECCEECPEGFDGGDICVTVPTGTFTAVTQAQANAIALASACAQAEALRESTPCDSTSEVSVQCRSASASATLCGCSEFANPTSPNPKKYLRFIGDWRYDWDYYASNPCPGGGHTPRWSHFVWDYAWNPVTCTQSGSGTGTAWDGSVVPLTPNCGGSTNHCGLVSVLGKTTITWNVDAAFCCSSFGVDGFKYTSTVGLATLSEEDTEEDAIARDYDELTWSAFGDCDDSDPSYLESRGAGDFTFEFTSVESRATAEGLLVGADYRVTFTFESRAHGSADPWVVMGTTHVVEFEATATTEVLPDITLPLEHGMDVRIASCVIDHL